MKKANTVDDVWKFVRICPTDCWEWQGSVQGGGYGLMMCAGKQTVAHRLAFESAYGVPPGDFDTCHTCDNRRCCRPSHLFLGTRKVNIDDMIHKGRQIVGEGLPQSKLKVFQVRAIRLRHSEGQGTYSSLAREYRVSITVVRKLCRRETWKSVV